MDSTWPNEFRDRMRSFEARRALRDGEISVSLKVRVTSGCFHREHSPNAYELIDRHIAGLPASEASEFEVVEHESGPEILLYLALTTASVSLAKSIVDLVVVILKARAEGLNRGDQAHDPLEIIIRRIGDGEQFFEETIVRIRHNDAVDRADIETRVTAGLNRLCDSAGAKGAGRNRKALDVFIALSSKDDEHLKQLENHLAPLRREGRILPWHFRKITAGSEWEGQIDRHINSAYIILLLISVDFLASDYCYDVEMTRALERHNNGEARVVPIILSHCDWRHSPLGKLQALPKDGRPVTGPGWSGRDEAYDDIAQGIRKVVDELSCV